jgi:hypothetical protein
VEIIIIFLIFAIPYIAKQPKWVYAIGEEHIDDRLLKSVYAQVTMSTQNLRCVRNFVRLTWENCCIRFNNWEMLRWGLACPQLERQWYVFFSDVWVIQKYTIVLKWKLTTICITCRHFNFRQGFFYWMFLSFCKLLSSLNRSHGMYRHHNIKIVKVPTTIIFICLILLRNFLLVKLVITLDFIFLV